MTSLVKIQVEDRVVGLGINCGTPSSMSINAEPIGACKIKTFIWHFERPEVPVLLISFRSRDQQTESWGGKLGFIQWPYKNVITACPRRLIH